MKGGEAIIAIEIPLVRNALKERSHVPIFKSLHEQIATFPAMLGRPRPPIGGLVRTRFYAKTSYINICLSLCIDVALECTP